ncbi:MAG: hypothetical protein GQ556_05050 [Desulfobacterales bacterium]|nr:hypothetical protein [Desulfobacterales bacterium]
MNHMITFWYGATSFLFAAVLFFPVRKLLMSINVNRIQNKHKRAVTEEELKILKKKVNVVAAIISVSFAFFYNKFMIVQFFSS